jgi:hypothetical protein
MTKKNTNKKSSVSRKLIPAIGMLTVSAMMLSSATYAWFTMSKEVSLTGIQMTASTPEDIQISLGLGTEAGQGTFSLMKDASTAASFTSNACNVGDPNEEAGTTDWSNTIPVGSYYTFGHLTPATSMTGTNVFYTREATGVGKTIREDGSVGFGENAYTTFTAAAATDAGVADPSEDGDAVALDDATGGKYYIDIPVWFRTSVKGNSNINLAVIATFTDPGNDNGNDSIVKAARVALLDTASSNASAGVICDNTTSCYHTYASSTLTDGDTAVYTSGTNTWATNIASVSAATSNGTNSWGNVTYVKQATTLTDGYAAASDTTVVTVPMAGTNADWGTSHKYILRVWLEGEDVNCWNETAAQDFQIDLRFIRQATA